MTNANEIVIDFSHGLELARSNEADGEDITQLPVLKLKGKSSVVIGGADYTHLDMIGKMRVSAEQVGAAARLSISPAYKLVSFHEAGTSMTEDGYVPDPAEMKELYELVSELVIQSGVATKLLGDKDSD